MTFHDYAERQAHEALQAVLTSVSAPLRKELDALVEDLSGAAEREAEQAAVCARRGAELAAEVQLATAQAAAEVQLARERADGDALRRTIEDLQAQMQAAADAERTALHAVRAEMTRTVDEAQAAHAALSASLAAAQQDVAVARTEVDERTARLEATERRLQAVEEAHVAAQQALAISEERLAHEQQLQQRLAQQHSDAVPLARLRRALRAFADLTRASDALETFVDELAREFGRAALFTVRENRLEGLRSVGFEPTTDISNLVIPLTIESPLTRAASQQTSIMVPGGAEGPIAGLLGHETHGVIAIPIVTTEDAVAVAYAELAHALPVEGQRIAWQIAELLGDYVTGAFARAQRSTATPADDATVTALVGHDDGGAAPASRPETSMVQPAFPGPVRAADRVSVQETVEVLVDGGTAQLVDISLLGAQVLCTKAIRPTHRVRLVLPLDGQAVPCQGRVVWAVFEIVPSGGRYRAGLQFIHVDTNAVEAFLNQQLARNHRKPEPQPAHCRG